MNVAVWLGVAERDGVADGVAFEGVGEGLGLADTVADGEGDAEVGRADAAAVVARCDAAPFVTSGTLSRTSWGAAPSRDGVSYENSPLAKPAAATTVTTAPAAESTRARRDRRGRRSSSGP
ncbi:hypothetical protein [Streptomyces sp. HUAS TT20]|uniref:hypothetical protein n=1 Tax=Streptomyces sp. HUAS TT20 TaxID=3447509 RepID=UPI0029547D94|nr:hypothetical protein [Streptomyces sp. HUAS 15-9]